MEGNAMFTKCNKSIEKKRITIQSTQDSSKANSLKNELELGEKSGFDNAFDRNKTLLKIHAKYLANME